MDYEKVMNGEVSAIDAYIDLYEAKALIEIMHTKKTGMKKALFSSQFIWPIVQQFMIKMLAISLEIRVNS